MFELNSAMITVVPPSSAPAACVQRLWDRTIGAAVSSRTTHFVDETRPSA